MSSFIRHLPCKACGSKDNLGEYTDHFWCFGCGFYEEKQDMEALRERLAGTSFKPLQCGDVRESLTFTKHIPKQAMRWLLCYRITLKEIEEHNILWCQENETLILVHTDNYWQGRQIAYARRADGTEITGIIAGSCYEHDEDYLNMQSNNHWRGVYMLHEVNNGSFDEMAVSLDYLKRTYDK